MRGILDEIQKWAAVEYAHTDAEATKNGHITLYAVDSGGYDITDGVVAKFTEVGIEVKVNGKSFFFIPVVT